MIIMIPQSGRALKRTLLMVVRALLSSHQTLNGPMLILFTQTSKQSLKVQEVSSKTEEEKMRIVETFWHTYQRLMNILCKPNWVLSSIHLYLSSFYYTGECTNILYRLVHLAFTHHLFPSFLSRIYPPFISFSSISHLPTIYFRRFYLAFTHHLFPSLLTGIHLKDLKKKKRVATTRTALVIIMVWKKMIRKARYLTFWIKSLPLLQSVVILHLGKQEESWNLLQLL